MRPFYDERGRKCNPGQFFIGGSKPSMPKQEPVKQPKLPKIDVPQPPPPPKPIPPIPTTSALEVQQAADDQKKQAGARRGVKSTLIAGDTGGYLQPAAAPGAKKTLLG